MVAPVIPALNDSEIERILDAAAHAGVKEASYVLLRLPLEVRDLFREWLMANYPDRYRHVFTLIRDMRDGRDYDFAMGNAHERHRADGLDDRAAFRDRLRETRPQQAAVKTDDQSILSDRSEATSSLICSRVVSEIDCSLNNGHG